MEEEGRRRSGGVGGREKEGWRGRGREKGEGGEVEGGGGREKEEWRGRGKGEGGVEGWGEGRREKEEK